MSSLSCALVSNPRQEEGHGDLADFVDKKKLKKK